MMHAARPRLLVSVRDAAEAQAALDGGADWIDLKDPQRGPLGAVDAGIAREVVTAVAGHAPLSAAAGELVDWRNSPSRELLAVDGLSLIKLGLAGCRGLSWRQSWQAAHDEIASQRMDLAAVVYADCRAADSPNPDSIMDVAAPAGASWLLLDTFDKQAGNLLDHFSQANLTLLLARARAHGLGAAVAGSLSLAAIPRLPLELIELVAVRTAACRGGRHGRVCPDRVAAIAHAIEWGCNKTAR